MAEGKMQSSKSPSEIWNFLSLLHETTSKAQVTCGAEILYLVLYAAIALIDFELVQAIWTFFYTRQPMIVSDVSMLSLLHCPQFNVTSCFRCHCDLWLTVATVRNTRVHFAVKSVVQHLLWNEVFVHQPPCSVLSELNSHCPCALSSTIFSAGIYLIIGIWQH